MPKIDYLNPKHSKILPELTRRLRFSRDAMQKFVPNWKSADELYRSYTKPTNDDSDRTLLRKDGKPQYTTIVVPYSYALLLTAQTYWSSVFLSRTPVFQYSGRHGATQHNIQALEAAINYQSMVGEMTVPLYMWGLDAGKYGFGVIGNYWEEEQRTVARYVTKPKIVNGIETGEVEKVIERKTMEGYQGNKIYNIRPYDFFPDPRVSIARLQEGEFCAVRSRPGWHTIRASGYYNLEHIKRGDRYESADESGMTDQLPVQDALFADTGRESPVLDEIYINLVPSEWGLDSSNRIEKWVFTIANDAVIIGSEPYGYYHDKFPFLIQTYETDTYSLAPKGMLETLAPLNNVLDWLINSHFFNIRKALNDQMVIDPSRISLKDILEGGPARIIKLRPAAYGTDVRTAYTQIPIQDVTKSHLQSMREITTLMQRMSGVLDNLTGPVQQGGRKTATEIRTSASSSINRMRTVSEFNSALGWGPLSQILVQNTQQFFTKEEKFRIVGDITQGTEFVDVRADLIAGFYDFVPVDGTLPIDRFAQATLWKEILFGLQQMPEIGQRYDLAGIFSWVSQLAGLKNIKQFEIQPDNQVQQAQGTGNVIPIEGLRGAG